jgi:hypothetical protein
MDKKMVHEGVCIACLHYTLVDNHEGVCRECWDRDARHGAIRQGQLDVPWEALVWSGCMIMLGVIIGLVLAQYL